jgi:plasmid stabilization system protein ParE
LHHNREEEDGPVARVPRLPAHHRPKRKEQIMPRGDKSAYTSKQKREAEHIEEGYEKRGVPEKEAARRAWATVNKSTGGGKKSGSGRGKPVSKASARTGGKKGGAASASRTKAERSASARKAAATRARHKKG